MAQRGRPTFYLRPTPSQALLQDLLEAEIIAEEDWRVLDDGTREELWGMADPAALLHRLVDRSVLTGYQADHAEAGSLAGLMLGPYRVLQRLGSGAMGVVYKAEHVRLRRPAALKVLSPARHSSDRDRDRLRFDCEARAVARLDHPNIVAALDAGEVTGPGPGAPTWHYLAMEYVPGDDLEGLVRSDGPMPIGRAVGLMYQVASALAAAHAQGLIHRDIKPANIRVTPEGRAKLLDFGLSRTIGGGPTEHGTVMGTIEYMAPEQARADGLVDIRADIYGLGGTLFWCLTGRAPFAGTGWTMEDLLRRQGQRPPSAREVRPDVPPGLDAVLARLMAVDPADRYAEPEAAMRALAPFLPTELHPARGQVSRAMPGRPELAAPARAPRILLVDDESGIREVCRYALEPEGFDCDEAEDGEAALRAASAGPYDVVLLDVDLPGISGPEVCRRLRADPPGPNIKIIMVSGHASGDEMARMLLAGADDYLAKPFGLVPLQSRIKAALRHKESQDRGDRLNRGLLSVNHELEQAVTARDCDLVHARNALVMALAKLAESRDNDTGEHLLRLQRYTRVLAEELSTSPGFASLIDSTFIATLECCVPLHDIGKVALPDHILCKPGPLEPAERLIMQTHAAIGAETLRAVAERHGFARGFLQMAIDIARHHHERFDGRGYPDRLAGLAIPLAARIVAICDVYDALRTRRVYKPALPHRDVLEVMALGADGQFDPALWNAFLRCAPRVEQISNELDGESAS